MTNFALSSVFAKHFLVCLPPGSATASRTPSAREGAELAVQMQLVKAERPPLESEPCVTLDKSLALSVPSSLLCKVAIIEALNLKDYSEDSLRSCRERARKSLA